MRYVPALLLATLVACGSNPVRTPTYTVKRGDTLYAIAQRHRLDHRDLARWNGRGRDNVIYPGQVLRLYAGSRAPGTTAKPGGDKVATRSAAPVPPAPLVAPPVQWLWPVDGGIATLMVRPNGGHGLVIRGIQGQEIRSAASGRVVYTGTGLLGLGQLLIIKHNESYLSAYGHTESMAVHEGDYVAAGQRVATMGTDTQGTPALYFEIRVNGAPTNPLVFLPARPAS
jgi:lipoprotein NlpD